MLNLTQQGQTLVQDFAVRHSISTDAALTVMQALIRGNGRAAQFSHPEFGGHVQWMTGGMVMAGDMNSHDLKAKIDKLCTDMAAMLAAGQSPDGVSALFIPDASRTTGHWWPFTLGSPAAAGSQNKISYALFPEQRRLAVEIKGHVTVYDTGDYQISGLAQQEGDETSLTFISQRGPLTLADLKVVGEAAETTSSAASATSFSFSTASTGRAVSSSDDVIATIERLAGLKDKGILTPEEFAAKKAELLGRL
jgi:hypothetical protein